MAKANLSHDLTIETLAGTPIGFMLMANAERLRGHGVRDAETIQPRQLTMGALTESESPPDIALYWSQEDWTLGLGGINHRSDPKKIALGQRVETIEPGKIRLASTFNETTLDTGATTDQPTGFAQVGTEVWAFIGSDVYIWDDVNLEWEKKTIPVVSSVKLYRNGTEYAGHTYAPAIDESDNTPLPYIFKADADAQWTLQTTSNTVADFKYFAKGRNADGVEILWGGHQGSNVHQVRNSSIPDTDTTATWSDPISVGTSESEITALVQDGDSIIVCKTNGVWIVLPNNTTKNLTPGFETMTHADNFRNAFNWNGKILLPLGGGGMMMLSEGVLSDVSMELFAPDQTSIQGRVVAITGDAQNLVIDVYNGTTHNFLLAKWVEFNGKTDFRWHRVAVVQPTSGSTDPMNHTALFMESVTAAVGSPRHRFWWGTDAVDTDILPYFYPFPTSATDDVQHRFVSATGTVAHAITVAYDGGFPRVPKTFQSFDATFNNVGAASRVINVDYRIDGGAFVNLGDLDATSGEKTLAFGDGVTGKKIDLRFNFINAGETTVSPELIKFRVTSQLRPSPIKMMTLRLYLADNMQLLNGAEESRIKGNLAQLRTWDAQAAEVTVIDSEGTSRDMVFLPGKLVVEEVAHEFGRRPEYVVSAQLAEV